MDWTHRIDYADHTLSDARIDCRAVIEYGQGVVDGQVPFRRLKRETFSKTFSYQRKKNFSAVQFTHIGKILG